MKKFKVAGWCAKALKHYERAGHLTPSPAKPSPWDNFSNFIGSTLNVP
jgi:hypothetical protein|tara:strand:- start:711 stop:854 length:144 start_codon:yes stop_codon:yes gene_type:complete